MDKEGNTPIKSKSQPIQEDDYREHSPLFRETLHPKGIFRVVAIPLGKTIFICYPGWMPYKPLAIPPDCITPTKTSPSGTVLVKYDSKVTSTNLLQSKVSTGVVHATYASVATSPPKTNIHKKKPLDPSILATVPEKSTELISSIPDKSFKKPSASVVETEADKATDILSTKTKQSSVTDESVTETASRKITSPKTKTKKTISFISRTKITEPTLSLSCDKKLSEAITLKHRALGFMHRKQHGIDYIAIPVNYVIDLIQSNGGLVCRDIQDKNLATAEKLHPAGTESLVIPIESQPQSSAHPLKLPLSPFSGGLVSDQFITSSDPCKNSPVAVPSKIAHGEMH
ncbi:hypothetical protein CHS0354_016684 [Potamilus streckersoni]|uniref:Uncharacterized protein n=1 Tax=Potamilus streckersoni TaxID=2493646 RepID=A0AAE0TIC9_9BIVA|nr:hypothetical protein CHS0354_016684 [Potamilus streckersoni]